MVLSSENDPVKADDTKEIEEVRKSDTKQKDLKEEKNNEMTEEDRKLQEDLELIVQRLIESNTDLYVPTLEMLKSIIRSSTTSMTSVPKPLKFLRPHYSKLKELQTSMPDGKWKDMLADIISVLAMCADEKGDCLNFRLEGMNEPIENWGHEYVRHLAMEIGAEWRSGTSTRKDSMEKLITEIVIYNLKHNAEVEACDLLLEIERLDILIEHVKIDEHERACLYLLSSAPLSPDPDNTNMIKTAMQIYSKFGKELEALRCAVMLNDPALINKLFNSKDDLVWKQMAILLGRHQIFIEDAELPDGINDLNNNMHISRFFRSLARELDIMEPKTPEGIYKTHLEQSRPFGGSVNQDNSRMNIAASFVNGFVNCGFGVDKILDDTDTANRFFFKNREVGIMTSVASLGLIHRWDIEYGLGQCDRFLYSTDDFVRAGTLLAIGIICAGVQDPCDPASALLMDHINNERHCMRIGSIFGLGLAYANSKRETVTKEEDGGVIYELKKVLNDNRPSANAEIKGMTALSLGLILVGTGDSDAANEMLTLLMERSDVELSDHNWAFVGLGIALIFLGTQQRSEVLVESLRSLPEPFGSMVSTLVDVCAYAGTGNVLKIQNLLYICSEHYEQEDRRDKKKGKEAPKEKDKEDKIDLSSQQGVAVLGIGLIAMGEEIGSQMATRMFANLMRYGEPVIRRAVPLALSLLSISNPQLNVLETLSKYSHDSDAETARNAIFAMGLVGAGTNNARLVAMLRQLASYHHKDSTSLMLVRISQGLTHLGKGTMTLNPFHSDRQILSSASVAALFVTCFSFLDNNTSVLNNQQNYLIYSLSLAVQPRMLITLIEDTNGNKDSDTPGQLKQINVPVRVGQAVDVVAQAGKPKTITGFQTHTTPVLLAFGERAELATDEYIALTPFLEGLVILKKNPNAV
uniref:26S proteasome non-ATPase regulatory subunit 2 n=1 Tax=Panagrolaimus sp. ES5 TaxID=591445 RepID=A0AC34GUR2_9BILA